MRIQHNIMAMNAYRNFGNNTSALSKNLEKLSSGYKINRAGDDAAGLAISEKMRAQITGLKAAQKNVKDGISLVKTAEGAMQEIHDMLNRMDYLATQSANGTYDNEVDRANLQKEVESLKSEIDRISKSANFNGQKLLDGSLSEPKIDISSATIKGAGVTPTPIDAKKGTSTTAAAVKAGTTGGLKKTLTVEFADANGKIHKVDVEYTNDTNDVKNAQAMADALNNSEVGAHFDVTVAADKKLVFTNKQAGPSDSKIISVGDDDQLAKAAAVVVDGEPAKAEIVVNGMAATTGNDLKDNDSLTINGTTYQFVDDASKLAGLDKGVVGVLLGNTDKESLANLNEALKSSGISVSHVTDNANGKLVFTPTEKGSAMKLQIGDTSADYEQLEVSIGNMSSASLGIGDLDIGTPDGAHAAIDKIKAAINSVSATRGDLGAIQNRLEHTQNNLSVMTENIQDAEGVLQLMQ